jgi:Winged helix DNA-binding domain
MLAAETRTETLQYRDIIAERERRWHMRHEIKVYGDGGPLWFINKVGIATPFSRQGLVLPTLWAALAGRSHDLSNWHDHYVGKVWNYKDTAPGRKEVWYGKFIKGKPTFISLGLFPAFYTLSSNYGELDDYLEEYADGRLSEEAKRVYEAVLALGPASTTVLRRELGMQKNEAARRFDRAINELQAGLKVMQVGTASDNRWKYCFVYDAVPRHLPEPVQAARQLTSRQAAAQIISVYLSNAYAVPRRYFSYLFGWPELTVERTISDLLAEGKLREVSVEGGEAEIPAPRSKDTGWLAWAE